MSDEQGQPAEADPADAADQRLPAGPGGEPDEPAGDVPPDADPADAAEQRRPVPMDEDDYR